MEHSANSTVCWYLVYYYGLKLWFFNTLKIKITDRDTDKNSDDGLA